MLGGWNAGSELSQEQYELVVSLKNEVEGITNAVYENFQPLKIKQQVVAGINYNVKVQTAEGEYIHVKIFKPLPHTGQPAKVTDV